MREHGDGPGSRWHKHWRDRGPGARVGIIALGVIAAAGFFVLGGFIVVWLWNWLMPALFKLPTIGFWQAWGILVLSSILFKRHSPGNQMRAGRRRRFIRQRMRDMGDEDTPQWAEAGDPHDDSSYREEREDREDREDRGGARRRPGPPPESESPEGFV